MWNMRTEFEIEEKETDGEVVYRFSDWVDTHLGAVGQDLRLILERDTYVVAAKDGLFAWKRDNDGWQVYAEVYPWINDGDAIMPVVYEFPCWYSHLGTYDDLAEARNVALAATEIRKEHLPCKDQVSAWVREWLNNDKVNNKGQGSHAPLSNNVNEQQGGSASGA